jgi:hypothetical protein
MSRDRINYSIHCPVCKDSRKNKRKLVVRLDDARYHCWVCDIKGRDVRSLIHKFRPDLIETSDRIKFQKVDELEKAEEKSLELPRGSSLLGNTQLKDPDMIATKRYLIQRGLSEKDLMRWRILGSPCGKFRRKAIIPSFDRDGNLNYYVARSIDNTDVYRYKNAKVSKGNIIFNEIDVNWNRPIILVEGVFDAIKCPENTIPILGSSLSRRSHLFQQILLNQAPCTVALDPDLKHKAYKLADLLVGAGCSVNITFPPTGKDLGDLSKSGALSVLSRAEVYSDIMRITHKISKIKSGSIL